MKIRKTIIKTKCLILGNTGKVYFSHENIFSHFIAIKKNVDSIFLLEKIRAKNKNETKQRFTRLRICGESLCFLHYTDGVHAK